MAHIGQYSRRRGGGRRARRLALVLGAPLCLVGCAPRQAPAPVIAASPPVVVHSGQAATTPPAIVARPLPQPQPVTAAKPPPPGRLGAPQPPVPAMAAKPPSPVAARSAAPPPGVTCPPGTIGVWSRDVINQPVYVCRPATR